MYDSTSRAEPSVGYCLSSTSPPDCSAAPAGARDRDRSRRHARPGRPAATVLVVGLVLLGAAAAEAQTPPAVSSVELTSDPGTDNTYKIGDAVAATVTFSEAVEITGTPQLELDLAGTAKAANCTAAMNTTTMVCAYTVAVNDSAPNGVAIAANKLTGGTITATGSMTITADLNHVAVAIDANHKVDGIRPTLVTIGTEAPRTSTDGTKVILTFSETISSVDQTKITIQANSVTAATSAASVAGTTVVVDLTTAVTSTTPALTVGLAADAVFDAASNGILAVAATAVTNAVVSPNAPPTFSSAIVTRNVAENSPAGTNVGAPVTATDTDSDDTLTYTLEGTDADSFDIVSASGQIQTKSGVTYETKSSYAVTVKADDGNGGSDTIVVTITLTDVDAPKFSSAIVTRNIAENSPAGTDVGEPIPAATDANGDTLTYSMEGQDEASFDFDASTRQIRTTTGETYDYETKSSYAVTVRASDATDSDTIVVRITVTAAPKFSSAIVTRNIAENSPAGTDVGEPIPAATDANGDTLTYSMEGQDEASFDFDASTRQIRTTTGETYDYETKSSYAVTVRASDATDSDTIVVTITLTDVDEASNTAPTFSSAIVTRNVAENSPAGTNVGVPVTATDTDSGDTLTYTLEGTDAVSFDIVSTSGQIQTTTGVTYDYETQSSYAVIVKADDGNGGSDTIMVTITVTDVNEPPARPAAPSVSSVAGSTTSLSVMWTAPANTGPAIDTYDLRYRQGTSGSWTNGPQNVSGLSATITGLGAGSYQVQVLATNADGDSPWSPPGSGQTNTADNTAPTFSSPTASRSVAENSAAGTNVGAPVTATDADSGDTLTYTLDGTDAASFDIVSTSGQIQTTSGVTYDYETQSSYAVIVKADDGNGGSDTIMVTITVTDVDESPSPGPEPVPTPALPLLGHLLLALGLTAAGARVIRRRPRVPPAA